MKENVNMAIYMDSTTMHVSADSTESVNNSLQQELMMVSHWIVKNKLTLNVLKTKCIVSSFKHDMSFDSVL